VESRAAEAEVHGGEAVSGWHLAGSWASLVWPTMQLPSSWSDLQLNEKAVNQEVHGLYID